MKFNVEKDYWNYDYITLTVKRKNIDEVIRSYGAFLWKEIARKEDRQYYDILHVMLKRPHKIKDKDRLQLLQVKYEAMLNKRAYLDNKKYTKSQAVSFTLAALGAGAVIGALSLFYYGKTVYSLACGCLISAAALALGIVSVLFIKTAQKRTRGMCVYKVFE